MFAILFVSDNDCHISFEDISKYSSYLADALSSRGFLLSRTSSMIANKYKSIYRWMKRILIKNIKVLISKFLVVIFHVLSLYIYIYAYLRFLVLIENILKTSRWLTDTITLSNTIIIGCWWERWSSSPDHDHRKQKHLENQVILFIYFIIYLSMENFFHPEGSYTCFVK